MSFEIADGLSSDAGMMDRFKCCVLVAGCAIIVLAVVVVEPVMVTFKATFIKDCKRIAAKDRRNR